jgi:tellurite resistance protein TerC
MVDLLLPALTLADTLQITASGATPKFWAYAAFIGLVIVFLALDLGVFHRDAHEVSFKEALKWSVVWVTCGVGFAGVVYGAYDQHWMGLGRDTPMYNPAAATDAGAALIVRGTVSGSDAAQQYLTGYVVEKSLAMDNIFVIAMIFGFFAIPAKYQHRVLFWGIIGALLMRGAMIGVGGALILEFMWVLIIFGLFLLLTSLKMALIKSHGDPGTNPVVRLVRRCLPITTFYDGQRFLTRRTEAPTYSPDPKTGRLRQDPARPGTLSPRVAATPLLLALIMVEITDLVFAVDSIPAIFAITPDPFIVFTSNIFAILGLRSLYFCLAAMIAKFRYLKPALILILAFVGAKLLLLSLPPYLDRMVGWIGLTIEPMKSIKIDTTVSLVAVLGTLGLAVVLSVLRPARAGQPRSEAIA